MAYLILILNVFFVVRYKWRYFNFHQHKVDFYLSVIFSLLLTGVHRIEILTANEFYKIKMGFPLAWIDKYLRGDELFEPMNYFAISEAAYRIDIFVINTVMIYIFMVGFRTLVSKSYGKLE